MKKQDESIIRTIVSDYIRKNHYEHIFSILKIEEIISQSIYFNKLKKTIHIYLNTTDAYYITSTKSASQLAAYVSGRIYPSDASIKVSTVGSSKIKRGYENVTISEAINQGFFSRNSRYYNMLELYGIERVCIIGNKLVGPSFGMMEIISDKLCNKKYTKIADLFAGSAAYSKQCRALCDCVVDAYDVTMPEEKYNDINYYMYDLIADDLKLDYELIIIDAPKSLNATILRKLINQSIQGEIVIRLGSNEPVGYIETVRRILDEKLIGYEVLERAGEVFVLI